MLGFGALGQFALGEADNRQKWIVFPDGFGLPVNAVRPRPFIAALAGAFSTLVLATSAGPANTTVDRQEQDFSVQFAKPFPAALQQFDYRVPQPVSNVLFQSAWYSRLMEYGFAKPFPVEAQQYVAYIPEHVPGTEDVEGVYAQPPDLFVKPFPVSAQQWAAFQPAGFIASVFPEGWEGQQLAYRFKPPFADTHQQWSSFEPAGFIASFFRDGWRGAQYDYRYAKPFPVASQQYQAYIAEHVPGQVDVEGFYPFEWDYKFSVPFPIASQQYVAQQIIAKPPTLGWQSQATAVRKPRLVVASFRGGFQPRGNVPSPTFKHGFFGTQFDYRFTKPYPAAAQPYVFFVPAGLIPTGARVGAGSRKLLPSYVPQPPYDAKPTQKPYRPIWDKPPPAPADKITADQPRPVPLPPASLFAAPPTPLAGLPPMPGSPPPFGLPDFNDLVPPDPVGLGNNLREAQDMSDAMAALKALFSKGG